MTEEKKFTRKKPSRLIKIRDISPSTDGPIRILGTVIDSSPGAALVQDLFDEDRKKAGSIWITIEGTLEVKKKYLIIGELTEKTDGEIKIPWLNATLAHDIDTLDLNLYKEILALEDKVVKTMSG
ncbi:MAG: hypothetical protein JW779_09685 [Candidatus Thorarchaeota archaeon]|nr:hypothetical protein [Candidatus Thorarchaeota archaeon]